MRDTGVWQIPFDKGQGETYVKQGCVIRGVPAVEGMGISWSSPAIPPDNAVPLVRKDDADEALDRLAAQCDDFMQQRDTAESRLDAVRAQRDRLQEQLLDAKTTAVFRARKDGQTIARLEVAPGRACSVLDDILGRGEGEGSHAAARRVVAERDEAQRKLDDPYSEANQAAGAWEAVTDHPLIGPISMLPVGDTYADMVRARLDEIAESVSSPPTPDANNPAHCRFAGELSKQTNQGEGYAELDRGLTAGEWLQRAEWLEQSATRDSEAEKVIEAASQALCDAIAEKSHEASWAVAPDWYRDAMRFGARALHARGLLALDNKDGAA